MIVKYWAGSVIAENMEDRGQKWFDTWLASAKEADEKDQELLVFRIPRGVNKTIDPDTIMAIESLIKSRYEDKG